MYREYFEKWYNTYYAYWNFLQIGGKGLDKVLREAYDQGCADASAAILDSKAADALIQHVTEKEPVL